MACVDASGPGWNRQWTFGFNRMVLSPRRELVRSWLGGMRGIAVQHSIGNAAVHTSW